MGMFARVIPVRRHIPRRRHTGFQAVDSFMAPAGHGIKSLSQKTELSLQTAHTSAVAHCGAGPLPAGLGSSPKGAARPGVTSASRLGASTHSPISEGGFPARTRRTPFGVLLIKWDTLTCVMKVPVPVSACRSWGSRGRPGSRSWGPEGRTRFE